MRHALLLALLLPACQTLRYPAAPAGAIAPVVAVSAFENRSAFPGKWQLGDGMAELLLAEIVKSDRFVPVERIQLRQVMGELDLQEDRRFRPEGRAASGQLKGARYLIRGTITDFSQVSGGGFWLWLRAFVFMGRTSNARVALSLTIVEVESGEIVGSVRAEGYARAFQAYAEGSYGDVSFGGDAFFKTPLGVATQSAIRDGLLGIIDGMPTNYWRPRIADSSSRTIVINGGADRGIRVGDRFEARGEDRAVTDPITGNIITRLPGARVGVLRVDRVEAHAAFAVAEKDGPFRRGQSLKQLERSAPETRR